VPQATWFVYIVQCSDNTLYTGISMDPEARVAEHNTGQNAAKYTRARRPVSLLYTEPTASRSAALKREVAIKRLSRQAKLALISKQHA
jgi:putative endonuclease